MIRYLIIGILVIPIGGAFYYLLLNTEVFGTMRWLANLILIIGAAWFLTFMGLYTVAYLKFLDANKAEGGTWLKPAIQHGGGVASQRIRPWQWLVLGAAVLLAILLVLIR